MSCQMQNSPQFYLLKMRNWAGPGSYYPYDRLHHRTTCKLKLATEPSVWGFTFDCEDLLTQVPVIVPCLYLAFSDWCLYLAWVLPFGLLLY